MAGNFDRKLRLPRIHFWVLLHAANLRHGTNGFTSLPKECVLRIFSPWKIRWLRPGLNLRTWVPKASTLPLDHRYLKIFWSLIPIYNDLYSHKSWTTSRWNDTALQNVRMNLSLCMRPSCLGSGSTVALILNDLGLDENLKSAQGTGCLSPTQRIDVTSWIGNSVSLTSRLDVLETRWIAFPYRELNYTLSVELLLVSTELRRLYCIW